MSRIGKLPIKYSDDIKLSIASGVITVQGPNGTLTENLHPDVDVKFANGLVNVSSKNEGASSKALWGLYRSLINNMVHGVKEGYSITLEINGTGYKASVSGEFLILSLGFSHDIFIEITDNLKVAVKKNLITVSGPSKQKVGQFAANIRSLRKPEPYKGKGVKYANPPEVIRRKEGKNK